MIELSMGMILTLFTGVPLLAVAAMALFYNLRAARRPGRDNESIYVCDRCGHVYTFARNRPMDRCPRCDHLNDAVRT